MNITDYKQTISFSEWAKTHNPDKIYCVCTESLEALFDVYEDDFIEMVDKGIVNSEGHYYLLNNPTEEQIREYAKRYGIDWLP
jgi:hypothetical protein